MKRGRPSKRTVLRKAILTTLGKSKTPMTTSAVGRLISEELGERISWNTTQKYLRELVEANKVQPIPLPHSKKSGEAGLTLYTLKR